MRTQVKIFENASTLELEKELNEFLNGINTVNVVDIKYSQVAVSNGGYVINHFSAMVMYAK
ncbi:sporulation protein Cse60 [Paenibacillus sp. SAF-068]|uniref:sporulation protein Cse60 n=1 Tax=Paenibacillus sp. SAF-068 TaxID=3436864 RepID=UPI003F7D10D3